MNNKFILSIFVVICFFSSCDIYTDFDDDRYITDRIFVSNFTGIVSNVSADVYIRQGNFEEVRVEGSETSISRLDFRVRGGILDIENYGRISGRTKIFITVRDLDFLQLNGSGDVFSENRVRGSRLTVECRSSGDMDLDIDVRDLQTRLSGSGDIRLSGFADLHEVTVSSSGDVEAYRLTTDDTYVNAFSSGDIEVRADNLLDVIINGSGNVYYRGFPVLNYEISGSGDLIEDN